MRFWGFFFLSFLLTYPSITTSVKDVKYSAQKHVLFCPNHTGFHEKDLRWLLDNNNYKLNNNIWKLVIMIMILFL